MSKGTSRTARGAAYDKAMIDSGRRVVREAAQTGRALVGWKDGRLVVMKPESSPVKRANKSSGLRKAIK